MDSITVTPTAIKQLQILKHFSSVPLGVIGTRNCFPLRLLLACSAAALPRDPRLLPPPHNILAVDAKLSMYTCHSQSLYRLPLSLCSKTLPPCLIHTHAAKGERHTHTYAHTLLSRISHQTMKLPFYLPDRKHFRVFCGHARVYHGDADSTTYPSSFNNFTDHLAMQLSFHSLCLVFWTKPEWPAKTYHAFIFQQSSTSANSLFFPSLHAVQSNNLVSLRCWLPLLRPTHVYFKVFSKYLMLGCLNSFSWHLK